jgi:hypothetical protein
MPYTQTCTWLWPTRFPAAGEQAPKELPGGSLPIITAPTTVGRPYAHGIRQEVAVTNQVHTRRKQRAPARAPQAMVHAAAPVHWVACTRVKACAQRHGHMMSPATTKPATAPGAVQGAVCPTAVAYAQSSMQPHRHLTNTCDLVGGHKHAVSSSCSAAHNRRASTNAVHTLASTTGRCRCRGCCCCCCWYPVSLANKSSCWVHQQLGAAGS